LNIGVEAQSDETAGAPHALWSTRTPPHAAPPPPQLVNFAVRHKMDYVAASFVQSGDDVRWEAEAPASGRALLVVPP